MYINILKKIINNEELSSDIVNSNYSKISFSQFGEDLILEKIFKNIRFGKFLNLGSFHPIHFSNTFLLYVKGWRSINIDGNKSMIELTKEVRPDDQSIHLFLDGLVKNSYYILNSNNPAMNRLEEKIENLTEDEEYKKITTTTINEVIVENYNFLKNDFYYLNIDLKYKDTEILKQINFNLLKPAVISIEIHNFEKRGAEVSDFLQKFNYKLHAITPPTVFFILESFLNS